MKLGKDISAKFQDLYIVHQNLPGKKALVEGYDEHILFLPLQGEIKVETDSGAFNLSPGQMLYLSPRIPHSFSSSTQSGERLIAMLAPRKMPKFTQACSKQALNQLVKEVLFYLLLHPKTKNAQSLVSVFAETLTEILEQSPYSESLDHLEGKVSDPRVRRALHYMRKSLGESPSLGQIAKKAGLSPRNFNRLVRLETGIQPRQWMINFRIDRAQELLKKPGASVTEAALAVGYSSLSQFIAAFRSRTGKLPSEFLRRG
jgi:AraC-like DNA-binding protein